MIETRFLSSMQMKFCLSIIIYDTSPKPCTLNNTNHLLI